MTGLYCPGCHFEHTQFKDTNPADLKPGDIVVCSRCVEIGEYDGQALRSVPMWSTVRTPHIEKEQADLAARHIDYTIARLLHPSGR